MYSCRGRSATSQKPIEDPAAELFDAISLLKKDKQELDRDLSAVLARNTDLEMENARLKKQKDALSAENERRVTENSKLKVCAASKKHSSGSVLMRGMRPD